MCVAVNVHTHDSTPHRRWGICLSCVRFRVCKPPAPAGRRTVPWGIKGTPTHTHTHTHTTTTYVVNDSKGLDDLLLVEVNTHGQQAPGIAQRFQWLTNRPCVTHG